MACADGYMPPKLKVHKEREYRYVKDSGFL